LKRSKQREKSGNTFLSHPRMLRALSRVLVGWIRFGYLPKFGPSSEINENDVEQYLRHLESGFECSIELFILATKYLLRLHANTTQEINFRHAFLAALSLAHKYLIDDKPDSALHAYVGGVNAAGLARLEKDFLQALSYRLFVCGGDYQKILSMVEKERDRLHRVEMGATFFMPLPYTPRIPLGYGQVPPSHLLFPTAQPIAAWPLCVASQPLALAPQPPTSEWISFINPSAVDFSVWRTSSFFAQQSM